MKNISSQAEKIKNEIKSEYAKRVSEKQKSPCCGTAPSCCGPKSDMKGNLVKLADYDDGTLQKLPEEAVQNSFGCGNPLGFTAVKNGQTVIDIGSGAGIDCFIAAEKVGPGGKVIGIDMTQEMINKARENAKAGNYSNVEFRLGDAENMPVEDASAEWVISNCVINLSPDKPKVFAEIARVLKPGGQIAISDIVLGDDLPPAIAGNIYAWTGCIAGAIKESEYVEGLKNAGLSDVQIEARIIYDSATIRNFITNYNLFSNPDEIESHVNRVNGKIWSAKFRGTK